MSDEPVRFDTRVAILLRDHLLPWQELNVTAFLISGIATSEPGLVGEPYRDADDNAYLPMLRQPIMIFTAGMETLREARAKAIDRGIHTAIFTRDLFTTPHDAANRAAVRAIGAGDLDIVGLGVRGPRNVVDRLTKAARKHP